MRFSTDKKDSFGFRFWLGWILGFSGAFILAAVFWTAVLTYGLGAIRGTELILTWSAAVFGSWFLIVVPFMRKKERIWKRLNRDQEKAADAWLGGMALFIGLLIASAVFWSWFYREQLPAPAFHTGWAKAVFGTWLFFVIPFLIFMYRKADQILKEAVARQARTGPVFRTAFIGKAKRRLPSSVSRKLESVPPLLPRGHIVTAVLSDGRRVPHVFVLNANEVLGVYDKTELDFDIADIVKVEPLAPESLPPYEEERWLRLDGRA